MDATDWHGLDLRLLCTVNPFDRVEVRLNLIRDFVVQGNQRLLGCIALRCSVPSRQQIPRSAKQFVEIRKTFAADRGMTVA